MLDFTAAHDAPTTVTLAPRTPWREAPSKAKPGAKLSRLPAIDACQTGIFQSLQAQENARLQRFSYSHTTLLGRIKQLTRNVSQALSLE